MVDPSKNSIETPDIVVKSNSRTKISPIKIKPGMNIQDLVMQFQAFNSGRLAEACNLFKEMLSDNDMSIFLGLSGALVPAGMRDLIVDLLQKEIVDVVVTTGANLTHDLLEEFGGYHEKLGLVYSDEKLHERGQNRIYDVQVSTDSFVLLEQELDKILDKIIPSIKGRKITTPDLLKGIGNQVSNNSILGMAARRNIPIFSPAITDSILGLHLMTYSNLNPYNLDVLGELKQIIGLAFDAKKTGALIIGGGVPKNYIFQSMLFSGRELNSAIQITMDRPEHGGLSGASLNEAVSWGKISPKAKSVTVICDATIAFPILVCTALETGRKKRR